MQDDSSRLIKRIGWATAVTLLMVTVGGAQEAETERPNFLVILADDMGYSDVGAYGGEIDTPHLDRLAKGGLRFTQFYNAARCWPTRASLMTGYYAPQVRMDPARRNLDGLPGFAPLLSERLGELGYRSYHSGKWHIFLADPPVAKGGFDRSYRLRDHNRFFYPKSHFLDDERLPPVDPEDDYYATTAIAEYAIDFLKEHEQKHSDKPWMTYLAFNAPHFPLHAPQEDIDKYRARYNVGWDQIRRERLKRMKEIGIVSETTALPPHQPNVVPGWNIWSEGLKEVFGPREERGGGWRSKKLTDVYGPGEIGRAVAWDSLTSAQKRFQAEKMAVHAAMVDRMDKEIGRVLEQVEAMDDRESTFVVFLSDNGASAELIVRGDGHDQSAAMGSGKSYLCLGPGWSTASNTPLRLHKHWTHEGGASTPFIVNWPSGIGESSYGELRHTPGHVIDVVPTLLDLAGAKPRPKPESGPRLPGRSLVPALNEDAEIDRPHIFFRHAGNQALRVGDWKLVSRKREDEWQLYNMADDRNEVNDLSKEHPDRLSKMAERWQRLSERYDKQALSDR